MSAIKHLLHDQMLERERELEAEIHDHEMHPDPGLEHISDVINSIANIQEYRMRSQMQPEDAYTWQSPAASTYCPF